MSNGMEETKKKFILLSQIAKEKKYAQEYLGLLARRGDIGSIRIGKRWYTTWQWFEEFLENSKKKKTESAPELIEPKEETVQDVKISFPVIEHHSEKAPVSREAENSVHIRSIPREKEISETKILVRQSISKSGSVDIGEPKNSGRPSTIPVSSIETDQVRVPLRVAVENFSKTQTLPVREAIVKVKEMSPKMTVPAPKKISAPVLENKIEYKNKSGVISPNVAAEEKVKMPVFPRFAFSFGFAIIVFLLAISGYFVYSGELLENGRVAGASDEKVGGISGIEFESDYFASAVGDKMKESFSISQVIVEVARQKQEEKK